jgi:hypothetical protein
MHNSDSTRKTKVWEKWFTYPAVELVGVSVVIIGLSASFFLFLDTPDEPFTASDGTAPSGCGIGVVASFGSAAMPFIVFS